MHDIDSTFGRTSVIRPHKFGGNSVEKKCAECGSTTELKAVTRSSGGFVYVCIDWRSCNERTYKKTKQ